MILQRALKASQFVKSKHLSKTFAPLQSFALSQDSFVNGTNAVYMEQLFEQWSQDRSSVSKSLDAYFHNLARDLPADEAYQMAPTKPIDGTQQLGSSLSNEVVLDSTQMKIRMLITAYHYYGHGLADIDPLKLDKLTYQLENILLQYKSGSKRLDLDYYEFSQQELSQEYSIQQNMVGGLAQSDKKWKIQELRDHLHKIYCGKIGWEFMHISDRNERNWLLNKIENEDFMNTTKEHKLRIFDRLCENESFNLFCKSKFPTSKRFGIEGCDTLISGLRNLVDTTHVSKVEHLVFGMAHRGRLNTLAFVLKKPVDEIFAEFYEIKPEQQHQPQNDWGNSGDVKYHLGTTYDQTFENGEKMRLTILPNPSHLETVNPVVYGKTRAIQDFSNDTERKKSIGILIHGDAANAGQGIVYEAMQFQDLHSYTSGGIIHIIVNNQIGFTTVPRKSRSGLYCSDVAKTIESPIFHVNADDPEAVDAVMKLAVEYRQTFNKDVVVDLIGYRRYGHNELDQPSFTQPLMYQKINSTKDVFSKYSEQLINEKLIDDQQIQQTIDKYNASFDSSLQKVRQSKFDRAAWLPEQWEKLQLPTMYSDNIFKTGVPLDVIRNIGLEISSIKKEGFNIHPQLKKIFQARYQSIQDGKGIDYGTAEALAFATILSEGYGVRLSGQDVQRGTFSHRHAVIHDQKTNNTYKPITNVLTEQQAQKFTVTNSNLSEYGVMGFEYGYNISNPNQLNLWEAQFGDFANVAQIMIDNMIVSGEYKWGVQTGLCILLPHGMDGQGPEHSSGRIERFLQMSDDHWQTEVIKKIELTNFFYIIFKKNHIMLILKFVVLIKLM